MSDVYSNADWTEFAITTADLDRLAAHLAESGQAADLMALARRVVRGRLRHGQESSPAAPAAKAAGPPVRLWDPAVTWAVGDPVIVACMLWEENRWEPLAGEVAAVHPDRVEVYVSALREARSFSTCAQSKDILAAWRKLVEELVEERRGTGELEDEVELVLLEFGERVLSLLLDALRADGRFLALEGRWFARKRVQPLSQAQQDALYRQLLRAAAPLTTPELLPLAPPPVPAGDDGLFSLYATLLEAPERFHNQGTASQPRWQALRPPPPPPERAVGTCYAYDPQTYEILVHPGQRMTTTLARRLQELGLYADVVRAADGAAL